MIELAVLIVAVGFAFFLILVGSGIQEYLSGKNKNEEKVS